MVEKSEEQSQLETYTSLFNTQINQGKKNKIICLKILNEIVNTKIIENGGVNLDQNKNYFLEKALDIFSKNVEVINKVSFIYFLEKNYEKSKELYKKSLQISPTWEAFLRIGRIHIEEKKFKEAELIYREGIKEFPETLILELKEGPQVYIDLGDIARLKGNFLEAIMMYKKALDIGERKNIITGNTKKHILNGLGESSFNLDFFKEGEDFFNKSLTISDSKKAFIGLGTIYFKQGLYKKSEEFLQKAKKIDRSISVEELLKSLKNKYL